MSGLSNKCKSISPSKTLDIDAKFKAMKEQGGNVIGFGAGEPDFPTLAHIKYAAVDAIVNNITKYTPASGMVALKQAVCRKFKRKNGLDYSPDQIVVSNGAKQSLCNAFMALCNPGDEVIIPGPYWVSYPELVKLADAVPVIIDTTEQNNFKLTAADLEKALTGKTKAIVLNSPSNPTGMIYSRDELKEIADFAVKHKLYVISDEIYEMLIYDENEFVSIAELGEEIRNRTIVINGVSKGYAMTGWRIGYSASTAEIAGVMSNIQSHTTSNPNSIAQMAAIAALDGPQPEVETMRAAFSERRNYMVTRINSLKNVSCLKPQGAFYVMMNIEKLKGLKVCGEMVNTSDDLCNVLLDKIKIALVPGSGFGDDNYVRWSYAASMENIKEGIDRLENALG